MISRRNIRVKVMQTLYAVETMETGDQEVNIPAASKILDEKLNRSLDLFVISILYTLRAAQYVETDAHQRASKYLPTKEDLAVNTRLAGNELMWEIMSNRSFAEKIKEPKIIQLIDDEWIRKIYLSLAKTSEYQEYLTLGQREAKSERAILRFTWEELIVGNESLMEHFTDEFPGWEDDRDMIVMLMDNFFKGNPRINYLDLISAEKREYAHLLLKTVIEKKKYCMELIQPKLINWDAERVALIDLILLRMGVCELLYFPTIPTKVTINEFIEIAKLYSTPQSGQFVNGVLDNLLKELEKENRIQKQERLRKP
jgi:N utilization substance protein B